MVPQIRPGSISSTWAMNQRTARPRPISLSRVCVISFRLAPFCLIHRYAVTDPKGRITREGFESKAPRTAQEFAEYYNQSQIAQWNREDMDAYRNDYVDKEHIVSAYKESAKSEHATTAHPKSPFIISIPMQVRALMLRRAQILKGGIVAQIIQTAYAYLSVVGLLN